MSRTKVQPSRIVKGEGVLKRKKKIFHIFSFPQNRKRLTERKKRKRERKKRNETAPDAPT